MAKAYYDRALHYGIDDNLQPIGGERQKPKDTDIIFFFINKTMSAELFLKLHYDLDKDENDATEGHKLKELWDKLSADTKKLINRGISFNIGDDHLPTTDVYQVLRYQWEQRWESVQGTVIRIDILKALEEAFLSRAGNVPDKPSYALKLIYPDGTVTDQLNS